MVLNPKCYRLRLGLNPSSDKALPHLLTVRPDKLEIKYKELQNTPVFEEIDYYGLWVVRNYYEDFENGQYINQISSHKFDYNWNNDLPIEQTQKVYYYFADSSYDPEPEIFIKKLISPEQQSQVLIGRRKLIISKMIALSKTIRNGFFKSSSIDFFRNYGVQLNNYRDTGDSEIIDLIRSSPLDWLQDKIIDKPLDMTQQQYNSIESVAEALERNFTKANEIPTVEEIQEYLEQLL